MRRIMVNIDASAEWRKRFGGKTAKGIEYEGPGLYDKKTGAAWEGFANKGEPFSMYGNEPIYRPMIMRDMPEHLSVNQDRLISSRSEYREELKRTDTVPMERGMKGESPGYVDDRFAKANRKKSTQKAKDLFAQERKDTLAAAGLNDDMSSKPITAHIQFPS